MKQQKLIECPFLSVGGNKCSRRYVGKHCIYSKNVKRCPYYKDWLKDKRSADKACECSQELQEKDYEP
jgi:hypothetical protein